LSKIAAALGLVGDDVNAIADAARRMFDALEVPRRLRGVRVPRDALADVASHAMGDWFLRGNPRPVRDVSELQQVLEQSW
jgi:alcohol dehydrogenase class IV